MGFGSIGHWVLVLLVVVLLFGSGKISGLMGDFAEGIKAFKKGMSDDKTADSKPAEPVKSIEGGAQKTEAERRAEGAHS